ncbi:MAG: hypothetical protein JJU36_07840 [Phycisphaeraceae bacterium]|nr:hypothetical protein [Phycisphaeraceae bacterium]
MLTTRSIEKHLEHGRFALMAREVERNGYRPDPGEDKAWRTPEGAVAATLIRLLQIHHRPGDVEFRLGRFLLDALGPSIESGDRGETCRLARRALEALLDTSGRWADRGQDGPLLGDLSRVLGRAPNDVRRRMRGVTGIGGAQLSERTGRAA